MATSHYDVLIVGAGLSGIGAAYHLQENCPNKTYAILERRQAIGGTWDLFRYPGVRSDSDMFTLGYAFKPWKGKKAIASGGSVRDYIREAASENGIDKKIKFGYQGVHASWSTPDARWTIDAKNEATGEVEQFSCNFLWLCSGYYNYDQGYTPDFPGLSKFKGQFIHPQKWPENLDYTNKKVVIIGSGATAVTLLPSMAEKAAHVTMLQRSPTYMVNLPDADPIVDNLRKVLPEKIVYRITRARNISLSMLFYQLCRERPEAMKRFLLKMVKRQVGPNVDMKHFTPDYNPWDQRLCVVPNGDFFKTIREGKASIATDSIETFTKDGIKLKSGEVLQADIVITATGLDMLPFGGASVSVDGKPFKPNDEVGYKGIMLSNLPNAASVFGYINASWTLKADLVSEYICRVLNHMDKTGMRQCTPRLDPAVEQVPMVDMSSGYFQRALHKFPKQGSKSPWRFYHNYALDIGYFRLSRVEDGVMSFTNPDPAAATKKPAPLRKLVSALGL